jgi:putative transposase
VTTGTRHRRLPHIDAGGAAYFLTFRLHASQRDPLDDAERDAVVEHLRRMRAGTLLAFVVMPDHVHLLYLTEPGEVLARTLQALKGSSAHRLAKAAGRTAPIWQRDTFDRLVRHERELLDTWRYIEANPVRRGLSESPGLYGWSSAATREAERQAEP